MAPVLGILAEGVESVLVAQEAAAARREAVAVGKERDRLAHAAGVVLHCQVLQRHVLGVHEHRGAAGSADGARGKAPGLRGSVAVDDDRVHRVQSLDQQAALVPRDDDALAVDAGLDEDPVLPAVERVRSRIDGGLHRQEVPAALLVHDGVPADEVLRDLGQLDADGVADDVAVAARTQRRGVRVVLDALRFGGTDARLDPHEVRP